MASRTRLARRRGSSFAYPTDAWRVSPVKRVPPKQTPRLPRRRNRQRLKIRRVTMLLVLLVEWTNMASRRRIRRCTRSTRWLGVVHQTSRTPPRCIALRAYTKYNIYALAMKGWKMKQRTCSHRQIRNDNAECDLHGVPLAEVDVCVYHRIS